MATEKLDPMQVAVRKMLLLFRQFHLPPADLTAAGIAMWGRVLYKAGLEPDDVLPAAEGALQSAVRFPTPADVIEAHRELEAEEPPVAFRAKPGLPKHPDGPLFLRAMRGGPGTDAWARITAGADQNPKIDERWRLMRKRWLRRNPREAERLGLRPECLNGIDDSGPAR